MVIAWVVLGLLLLLFELHHVAFFALFLAIGSFSAAVVALVAPDAIVAQAVIAVVVSLVGVAVVRPYVSAAYDRRHPNVPSARGVHGGLVGQEAVTLDEVGDIHALGHVRLVGERWLAMTATEAAPIPPDTKVVVTKVQGTTLVVRP
jgi:membrane protein implicated in regulation of membrane protease activity